MSPRLYCPTSLHSDEVIDLPAAVAHHAARVLRLREGDPVTLFNGEGGEFEARLTRIGSRSVSAMVGMYHAVERESPLRVTLLQGLAGAERMDYVIQKAVEMGVATIAPVTMARSVTRLDTTRAAKRAEHWRSVIVASCEQCGRNRLPLLHPLCEFDAALGSPDDPGATTGAALSLVLSPGEGSSLTAFDRPSGAIRLLIGPEGGLAPEELAAAHRAEFRNVRLGPRVLRTETAGPAALAAMNALWGDWR
ncbi:MAG TPA: 16S rRNA (uracil(1498)-N(3))-methyltransferase [Casimicrobiaceae bacterium]|nr:16S rRNA (uracil(1498)-N(3))-methyltransferase [Casimicrobiaceae bacterium]